MGVMYNVDTWSTQLSSRLAGGALLLEAEAAEGHKRTNPEELVARAVKALEADARYHHEIFAEPTSRLVLSRIEQLGLPHVLHELGARLLAHLGELVALATRALGAMAAAAEQHKLKAMRNAAATRAVTSVESVQKALPALAERGVAAAAEQREPIEKLLERLKPLLPVETADSDDEEYY